MNKKILLVKSDSVKPLASRTGQAVLEMLPVDQKTIRLAEKVLQPKNLKRIAIAAVGGSVLISAVTSLAHDRVYKAAVAHEMKKQLEPLKKKLNELEAQNAVLYQQNKELLEKLETREQTSDISH